MKHKDHLRIFTARTAVILATVSAARPAFASDAVHIGNLEVFFISAIAGVLVLFVVGGAIIADILRSRIRKTYPSFTIPKGLWISYWFTLFFAMLFTPALVMNGAMFVNHLILGLSEDSRLVENVIHLFSCALMLVLPFLITILAFRHKVKTKIQNSITQE